MINGLVYKTINKINEKIYIGQTIYSLERRIAKHFAWAKRQDGKRLYYFHTALKKYGEGSFSWSVIDRARTRKALDRKERYWIKKLNCKAPNGYNCTGRGGDSPMNHPETAAKISGEKSAMKRSEVRAKISGKNHYLYGKHYTKEEKQLIREKRSGKNHYFWKGGKSARTGYLILLMPDHPRTNHLGYVYAHLATWMKHRGPIPEGKQVLFKDKSLKMIDKYGRRYRDPRISNLYIAGI